MAPPAPDSQRLIASWTITYGGLPIDYIAVDVMLDHVMGGIPPIIKNL